MTKNITIYKKYDGTWLVRLHRVLDRKLTTLEVIRVKLAIMKALMALDKGEYHAEKHKRVGA